MSVRVSGIRAHIGSWLDPAILFREATGHDPLEWQYAYLREVRNAVVLKGRQIGASTSASVLAIRHARLNPNSLAAIVSPSQKQSTEVKLRAKTGLERLRENIVLDNQTLIGLENGARILSLPGSPKSVRGWSADLLIIDEAAFLDPDTFLAARATVAATGGRILVQSTPAGPFGHFYELFMTDDPTWAKFRVRSDEAASIDPEFLASERATLTAEEFAQEYEAEFAVPGMGLVDPARLKELTAKPAPDPSDPWSRL